MIHDRAQVLLLAWPPQWHGHTDAMIGMAGGHTGLMQRYAPGRCHRLPTIRRPGDFTMLLIANSYLLCVAAIRQSIRKTRRLLCRKYGKIMRVIPFSIVLMAGQTGSGLLCVFSTICCASEVP